MIIVVLVPSICSIVCAAVKRLPVFAINVVNISYFGCNVSVLEIYCHAYGLHGTAMSLGCHFGVHVLDWLLEKFCSFTIL